MNYAPGHFVTTYNQNNGSAVWAFLLQTDNVVRMETATYLSRPAAEPLSPYLVKEFGPEIGSDANKKMVGHMIRQIMEGGGYRFDRSGARITRKGNIFTTAARYMEAI